MDWEKVGRWLLFIVVASVIDELLRRAIGSHQLGEWWNHVAFAAVFYSGCLAGRLPYA